MKTHKTTRLVRYEDLNHHSTLFAGRLSEWFVESCFICAAKETGVLERLVCLEILDFMVKRPTLNGSIVDFSCRVARTGTSSIIVHCRVTGDNGAGTAEGFITFVSLDEGGKPSPHGISLDETADLDELDIRHRAHRLYKASLEKR